jgi:hypothetical protein
VAGELKHGGVSADGLAEARDVDVVERILGREATVRVKLQQAIQVRSG